jgi:glutamate/tyrosine decarboxylase-like PLP-dependent enzyme
MVAELPYRGKMPLSGSRQMAAWFLGPKAENAESEQRILTYILDDYFHWRRNYFPSDEILITQSMQREALDWNDRLAQQVMEMLAGLRRHFPFYSPRYNAHMLSDQTIPGVLGYFAGMLYNPNNVTPESAPVTLAWELEVGADILKMLGYTPPPSPGGASKGEFGFAHITGGGTVANLEALWAARNVRYFPLSVRDVCVRHKIPLTLKLPNAPDNPVDIGALSPRACLGIRPNQAIYLYSRFIDAVRRHWDMARSKAIRTAHELLSESEFNLAQCGARAAFCVAPPALLVSAARHYSLIKAADLLGIGRENLILVDLDEMFRLEQRDLEAKLAKVLKDGMLPLAVVAIAGTTEVGAVDPVHRVADLRERIERTGGESFWLHVDAAWGGYLRSIFSSGEAPLETHLQEVNEFVSRPLTIARGRYEKVVDLRWGYREVCAALLDFPRAESITVDPHKLGYVPYPCGVIAYKNDMIRQFLTEEIPYISMAHFEDTDARRHHPPATVGPYILEGSKPGAAAAACWLSHRMIPPDRRGYGELIRASLLTAREFYERLVHWDAAARTCGETLSYRLLPLTTKPPDTNIVCFLIVELDPVSLERTNALNRRIFENFTLGEHDYSYSQPFFLSRTIFEHSGYSSSAIAPLLERAKIDPAEYRQHGLFVLRATWMSPYHLLASETGHHQSLIAEFIERLGEKARDAIRALSPA